MRQSDELVQTAQLDEQSINVKILGYDFGILLPPQVGEVELKVYVP